MLQTCDDDMSGVIFHYVLMCSVSYMNPALDTQVLSFLFKDFALVFFIYMKHPKVFLFFFKNPNIPWSTHWSMREPVTCAYDYTSCSECAQRGLANLDYRGNCCRFPLRGVVCPCQQLLPESLSYRYTTPYTFDRQAVASHRPAGVTKGSYSGTFHFYCGALLMSLTLTHTHTHALTLTHTHNTQ